jgi:hypothetical protein
VLPAPLSAFRLTVVASITVAGARGPIPGAVPLRVDLLDPQGRPSRLSGNSATRDGVWELRWVPAVNDPAGTWTIKVAELASGLKAEAKLQLEK